MISVIIFNIIAVFLALLESKNIYKHGLKLSLFTVFLFLALRYDYGSDYPAYLYIFQKINNSAFLTDNSLSVIRGNEMGWYYLNSAFGYLGFFPFIAFLSAFSCFSVYKFIKRYVPKSYFWFAIFIYVFQPYNMLVLSSAMRQAFVTGIFLLAIDLIMRRKVVLYLIVIYIATFFHNSAYFLMPMILLPFINWKINFIHIVLIGLLFIAPVVFKNDVITLINNLASQYFDMYSGYLDETDMNKSVGLGFFLNVVIYAVVFYYAQMERIFHNNILFKISIISFLIIPLSFGIHLTSRLNLYLMPAMMATFPLVFVKIKKIEVKILYITFIILFTLYNFNVFFNSEVWSDSFSNYKTIFSAPEFY